MKSNLVDALRRAQEDKSNTTLSDSGSFDATQEEFAAPANQDLADAGFSEDAGELELMSTTRGLAVNDVADVPEVAAGMEVAPGSALADQDDEHMPAQFDATMASATVFLTDSDCAIPARSSLPSMPKLARYVPVLCVALALIAGVGWQAYQRLDLSQDVSALGAFGVPSEAAVEQHMTAPNALSERFRYLSGPLAASQDEAAQ